MSDNRHNARILTGGAVGRYTAYCDHCGWRGPFRAKWETARDDAIAHDYKANRTNV